MEVDQPVHPLKKRKLMRDSLDKREQVIIITEWGTIFSCYA